MQLRVTLPPRPIRLTCYLLASVLCLCALAHANALAGPFLWDDRPLILGEPAVQQPEPLWTYFLHPFWRPQADVTAPRGLYRPLVTLSYVLDRQLHGENPAGFHLTNLALHLLACVLLFLLALRTGASPAAAALVTALWGLFPRLTESVTWISGRTDVLAACFSLGALLCWPPGAGPGHRYAGALLLLGGLLSKEVAAATALALAAGELAAGQAGRGASCWALVRRLVPLLLVGGIYTALRLYALSSEPPAASSPLRPLARAAVPLEALGTYILMLLDPWHPQTQIGLQGRPSVPRLVLGALALPVLALGLFRLRHASPTTVRAGVLAAAALALHLLPLPVDVVAADRFLYVPLLGVALLGAGACSSLPPRPRAAVLGAGALLAASFAVAVHLRNHDWADEAWFWAEAHRRSHPDNGRPLLELGNVYYRAGLFEEAIDLYRRAGEAARRTEVQKDLPAVALGNIANCLSQLGRYDEALALHRRLVAARPGAFTHQHDLGLVLLHQRRYAEAHAALRTALQLLPGHRATRQALEAVQWAESEEARQRAQGHVTPLERAELLTRLGRRLDAAAAWLEVARRPGASPDEVRRATAHLLLLGTTAAAQQAWDRYQRLAPTDPDVVRLELALQERRLRERRLLEMRALLAER